MQFFFKNGPPQHCAAFSIYLVSLQRICSAYELLDSPSLMKRCREKRLKTHQVSLILKPVVNALSYIHSLGIIRRDARGTLN